MCVVSLMTAEACSWSLAVLFACCMALAALNGFVRGFQFEICESVIERFGVKLNDIGFAALVVGMTGLAFRSCNAWALTVKTELTGDVGGDVLVAIKTETALAGF